MAVALVTDSTASLSAEVALDRAITVVPLQVVLGAECLEEGTPGGATPALVAEALAAFRPVSTSRPAPATFAAAYRAAIAAGATEIVSVHLSAEMSGTFESAQLAAREVEVPVHCVDSRQVGIGTGFAVLSAAAARDAGADGAEVARAAQARAAEVSSYFYVDTLEYLRRGGRVGAAAALVGSALSVKPLLVIEDGAVTSLEKVRTSARALSRLADLAVAAAGARRVDVGVAHLANDRAATELAERLATRLAAGLEGREVVCGEVGAALGAHVGPG
ncbi:MAG: DegV family protein, partial [Nocardioides sp.]